jgi:prophage antirepressor-like protein
MSDLITISNVRGYIEDGTAYLSLEDVARGLGFIDERNGVEYVRWARVYQYLAELNFATSGESTQEEKFIPENIFYRLAMKAKNDTAEKFQALVADEILPAIRKHGIYATDQTVDKILADPDFGIQLLTKYKEERAKRLQAEQTNAILMHVNKTYTSTEIAKELGFTSAMSLNAYLRDKRVQFKQNDTWVLYSDHAHKGYVDIKQEVLDSGRVVYHRRWTQLGREFLVKLIQAKGA